MLIEKLWQELEELENGRRSSWLQQRHSQFARHEPDGGHEVGEEHNVQMSKKRKKFRRRLYSIKKIRIVFGPKRGGEEQKE